MPQAKNAAQTDGTSEEQDRPDESNRERFVRLAQVRVNKVLDALVQTQQLANRNRYEYATEDVRAIQSAIMSELDKTVDALERGHVPRAAEFKLPA